VRAFGFNRFFVPEWLGGDLRAAEDILMLTRVIARRDMNVAVSESTQVTGPRRVPGSSGLIM
jgi:hypothetical protein